MSEYFDKLTLGINHRHFTNMPSLESYFWSYVLVAHHPDFHCPIAVGLASEPHARVGKQTIHLPLSIWIHEEEGPLEDASYTRHKDVRFYESFLTHSEDKAGMAYVRKKSVRLARQGIVPLIIDQARLPEGLTLSLIVCHPQADRIMLTLQETLLSFVPRTETLAH